MGPLRLLATSYTDISVKQRGCKMQKSRYSLIRGRNAASDSASGIDQSALASDPIPCDRVSQSEVGAPEPKGEAISDGSSGLVADSRILAAGTLVSRITGFGRVTTIAAVLGPTYFCNLYQASILIPNVIFTMLGGSLTAAILVPSLVKWIDGGDKLSVRRVASGYLGLTTAFLSVAVIFCVVCAPLLLRLVTAAVHDPQISQQQQHVGWPLLLMLLPQILLYGIAATGAAVQIAHGHFAVAGVAPALENLGVIAVLIASAMLFGFGTDLDTVTMPQLALLGLGSTAAVGIHAAVQWWGAYRLGVSLMPWAGWRDPDVKRIISILFRSSGYSALYNLPDIVAYVVAGRIPGGIIAFQVGQKLTSLPEALSAIPLSRAQLPRLARSFNENDAIAFHSILNRSLALARFITLPSGLLFIMISEPLARALAFGQMANPAGISIIAACIASLGLCVIGHAALAICTTASYARLNTTEPLKAITLRAGLSTIGMVLALGAFDGVALLWAIGFSYSAATLVSAGYLLWSFQGSVPAAPMHPIRQFITELLISVISIIPAVFTAALLKRFFEVDQYDASPAMAVVTATAAVAVSVIVYLAIQWMRGSSEFRSLFTGTRAVNLHDTSERRP